jgi:hypothetical protein
VIEMIRWPKKKTFSTRGWGRATKDEVASRALPESLSLWRYENGEEYIELRDRLGRGRNAKAVKPRFYVRTYGNIDKALEAARECRADLDYVAAHGTAGVGETALAATVTVAELLGDMKATPPRYGEYWTKHAFNDYEPSTLKGYLWIAREYIAPSFGWRAVDTITSKDVNDFKAYMLNPPERDGLGCAPSTVTLALTMLGSLFSFAHRNRYITEHPMHGRVRRPRPPMRKPVDPKHPRVIEEVCAQMTFKRATFVRTLAYEAMRVQEGLALTYGDAIDERGELRATLIVNKAIKGGTKAPDSPVGGLKTHRYSGQLSHQIRHPLLWRPIGEDILSLWHAAGCPPLDTTIWAVEKGEHRGKPWRTPAMWGRSHWRTACEKAGVRYDELKNLRHVGACLLMVGPRWDFQRIAAFMGNSAEVCAGRYTHLVSWADEFAGQEIEDIIRSVRAAPSVLQMPRRDRERERTNIELLREAMGL